MNARSASRRARRRLATCLGIVALVALSVPSPAQVRVTIDPAMARGPATAPVTIMEFSDYQ